MTDKRTKAEQDQLKLRSTRLAALQLLYSETFAGQRAHSDAVLAEDQECVPSDRAFLATLLSCVRTRRKALTALLRKRIDNRSWETIDLLLRLVLLLGAAEILLFEQSSAQQERKRGERELRKQSGRLVGEYCGLTSMFYEQEPTIGFINAVLDKLAADGVSNALQALEQGAEAP